MDKCQYLSATGAIGPRNPTHELLCIDQKKAPSTHYYLVESNGRVWLSSRCDEHKLDLSNDHRSPHWSRKEISYDEAVVIDILSM